MVNKFYQQRANPKLSHLDNRIPCQTPPSAPVGNDVFVGVDVAAPAPNHAVFAAHVARSLPFLAVFATHNTKRQVADLGKPA